MGFATRWLEKRALFPRLIKEIPDKKTGIIVVVPAFAETGITGLLNSLASCREPECKTEIIIIVNAPENAGRRAILNNKVCIANIETWKRNNPGSFFNLHVIDTGQSSMPEWGAGLARKAGMDEALRRFDTIDAPEGIIASLDADCTVEINYFSSLCDELFKTREKYACSVYFEHPLSGDDYPDKTYEYITLYELHLRYFIRGLIFCRFPYPFHTVGSAMAVKAVQYMRAGGMNRRQAGEDFYFIQKLLPLGGYFNLTTTTVYPSPRESLRVPFGTGPAMVKLRKEGGKNLLTYNIEAFLELRELFTGIENLFGLTPAGTKDSYKRIPSGIKSFISESEWTSIIDEIRDNTATPASFRKRFFGWFNMFRIVRYLNHVHDYHLEKQPVATSARELLSLTGRILKNAEPYDLLICYRSLDRNP